MQLSEERLIEQLAYYLVSLDDPVAAGLFIYNCMNESNDVAQQMLLLLSLCLWWLHVWWEKSILPIRFDAQKNILI